MARLRHTGHIEEILSLASISRRGHPDIGATPSLARLKYTGQIEEILDCGRGGGAFGVLPRCVFEYFGSLFPFLNARQW